MSLGTPAAALGAEGDLDATFGSGGLLTTDFAGNQDQVSALALQPDGKLVAAGRTSTGPLFDNSAGFDFGLARYHPDGSLDTSFGIDGKVSTDFAGDFEQIHALVLQPDGKLVAAGLAVVGGRAVFALARYHSGGSLDASFGSGGKLTTDFGGSDNRAFALVLQPDGKLVAAGSARTGSSDDFALVRYDSGGSLDASFGIGGKLTTGFAGGSSRISALVLQPDGKLVAAGYAPTGAGDFALARYEPSGSLDTAFGIGGKLTTDFARGPDQVFGLVLQPDGKLVAGGSAFSFANGSDNFALARYNADGSLDTAFGDGGKRTTGFPGESATLTALILQPNGKLVAAGWVFTNTDSGADFALARYDSSGSLDAAFGTGGTLLTDFANTIDVASALVRQPDGRLIAAGFTDSISDFAFARYMVEPNAPPVANAGSYPAQECTGPSASLVSLDGSASFDPDGDPVTYSWAGPFGAASGAKPTVALPLGTHSIALIVADAESSSTPALTQVTVVDTTPPDIDTLFASPSRLAPPNHKMVPVTVSVSAADACSIATQCRIVSVASNEPVNGPGDGDTAPDWRFTGDLTIELRAERAEAGTGRVYTITLQCTDASGNKSSRALTVAVPRG